MTDKPCPRCGYVFKTDWGFERHVKTPRLCAKPVIKTRYKDLVLAKHPTVVLEKYPTKPRQHSYRVMLDYRNLGDSPSAMIAWKKAAIKLRLV